MYKDITTGAIENDRILPLLYQLDSKDEWLDPTCWEKANPGLGKIKKIETLMDSVKQAKADPSFLPTVLTQDFNIPCTTCLLYTSTAYAGALWILAKELFKQQKRLKGIMGHVDMMRKVEDIDFWGAGEQDERL